MTDRIVEISGRVQLCYPRNWRRVFKHGWYPHVDGFGTRCWIRFFWDAEPEAQKAIRKWWNLKSN